MLKSLASSVRYIKGIGPKKAKSFALAGVLTVEDLLYFFPRRYEDRRNLLPINKLQIGQLATIKATVLARNQRRSFKRRGFNILEVAVGDETGRIFCVWFNQPYLKEYFKPQTEIILYGKIELYGRKLQMNSPEFEIISGDEQDTLSFGRITPVYRLPEGVGQRVLRRLIRSLLEEFVPLLHDVVPYDVRTRQNLLNLAQSLLHIHFPETPELQQQAYERLSFEEFFIFQLPLVLRKLKRQQKQGIAHTVEGALVDSFLKILPFELTAAQKTVIKEIRDDMVKPVPMQRLLQGDVGSGKTAVALLASMMAIQGGYQVAFMVPTEILAKQHHEKIKSFLLHIKHRNITLGILTGSADAKEKEKIKSKLKSGVIDLIIGTHALLEETVAFERLGLVVIDEQHKFGVGQRALLPQKGPSPDVLIMTATPIPRTLAITLYGDLDVSVINQMPPGRLPVKTIRFSFRQRAEAYALAKDQLDKGRQVFVVYPVIDESYALDMAGAKKMYQKLKSQEFKEFKLGLLHGRMKDDEQEMVMRKFNEQEIDLLVATTVLEVGIDIPHATCMIIENAERFGLSQLHQLRGRVGRGNDQAFCLLLSDADTATAQSRLEAMVTHTDGFHIAEEDLKIRGPGEFFGRRQHGLSDLKIGNPVVQMHLLKNARLEAIALAQHDPDLDLKQNAPLKERLIQRFPEYEKLIVVG